MGDLDAIPGFADGERPVLPDDVENGAGDGLRLLRRGLQLDGLHLRLRLLCRPPRHRRKHHRSPPRSTHLMFTSNQSARRGREGELSSDTIICTAVVHRSPSIDLRFRRRSRPLPSSVALQ